MNLQATVLYPSRCNLGEGPYWHAARNSCFWVDIEERKIFEHHWATGATAFRTLPHRVSLVVQDKHDRLILGLEGGLARYDFDTDTLHWLMNIERDKDNHRINDGKVDSKGRLWLGTMDRSFKQGAGSLYCVDENMEGQSRQTGVTISNGLAWSLDNTRLFYIDTPTQKVQCFLFDVDTGRIAFERDIINIPNEMGSPDGMAIDVEGMLWIAHWGGFGVYRWDPNDGRCIGKVGLPVPHVTSCAFVGPALDYLLITSARQDLSAADLVKYPASGDVYVLKMPVSGTLPNKCCF
ncbi:MAG TPA: SMP-30/gluconolactonase/LRE family protein [Puia sp.]|nr:SMP-30/gluconolactonase/LRE family protein [Puia sp.]